MHNNNFLEKKVRRNTQAPISVSRISKKNHSQSSLGVQVEFTLEGHGQQRVITIRREAETDTQFIVRSVRTVRIYDNPLKNNDVLADACGRYADAMTLPTVLTKLLKKNDKYVADGADANIPSHSGGWRVRI